MTTFISKYLSCLEWSTQNFPNSASHEPETLSLDRVAVYPRVFVGHGWLRCHNIKSLNNYFELNHIETIGQNALF